MNSSWPQVRLGDIADILGGFAFSGKHFSDTTGNVKAIKITDIKPPYINFDDALFVDISSYDKSKLEKYLVKNGDFVIAMTGATIGKIGRLKAKPPMYLNQRVAKVESKKSVDKDFVYYAISGVDFQGFIHNHIDSNSVQANISTTSIAKFPIRLPPLTTQCAIAATLSIIDDKIELNGKINDYLAA
jgi:type I restriction enzyme S subunit